MTLDPNNNNSPPQSPMTTPLPLTSPARPPTRLAPPVRTPSPRQGGQLTPSTRTGTRGSLARLLRSSAPSPDSPEPTPTGPTPTPSNGCSRTPTPPTPRERMASFFRNLYIAVLLFVHRWLPVRFRNAVALDDRGQVVQSLDWRMWLLCCVFFRVVQRSPAYLQRLAALLAPPGTFVLVRYTYRGVPQSLVFAQPPEQAPPGHVPMLAEVRLSEAGARIDATQLIRQLRAASSADLSPLAICAYLSYLTGVYLTGTRLTEMFIGPSATGPRLRRTTTEL